MSRSPCARSTRRPSAPSAGRSTWPPSAPSPSRSRRSRARSTTWPTALSDADSPWLVEPADELLTSLSDELAENAPKLDNAIDAVDLAPALLGADGPRVYLVLFTTPSEARALGGFPGNYAEITVDNGSFAMTAFGRVADLERAGVDAGARLAGPAAFLAEYGRYGFDKDGNGLVGTAGWRNLTDDAPLPSRR